MTLDGRRCAAGRLLTTLSLSLLGAFGLELGVFLGRCFSGFASLDLRSLLGALALQTVGGDQSLDLGALRTHVRRGDEGEGREGKGVPWRGSSCPWQCGQSRGERCTCARRRLVS